MQIRKKNPPRVTSVSGRSLSGPEADTKSLKGVRLQHIPTIWLTASVTRWCIRSHNPSCCVFGKR